MVDHDALIETLARAATPVRRLRPAPLRALAWAAIAMACGWIATTGVRAPPGLWSGGDYWQATQLALLLMLGVAALVSAFEMSIAGRSTRLQPLLVIGVLAWLAVSFGSIVASGQPLGTVGDGLYCFRFLLVASLPMMILVVIALRRTGSFRPRRTLLSAGLGIAALSASLLALCHPFALQFVDFLMHLAAIASIVALTLLLGMRWVAWPTRGPAPQRW